MREFLDLIEPFYDAIQFLILAILCFAQASGK